MNEEEDSSGNLSHEKSILLLLHPHDDRECDPFFLLPLTFSLVLQVSLRKIMRKYHEDDASSLMKSLYRMKLQDTKRKRIKDLFSFIPFPVFLYTFSLSCYIFQITRDKVTLQLLVGGVGGGQGKEMMDEGGSLDRY